MQVGDMPPPGQVLPRPFLLGVVLVLLVLSMQSDWAAPPGQRGSGSIARSAPRTGQLKDGVREKIIYDLSVDNERLELQVTQLKQYVLDLRRAARKCGCALDSEGDSAILTLYPELHHTIGAAGSGGSGGNSSGSGSTEAAALAAAAQAQGGAGAAAEGAGAAGVVVPGTIAGGAGAGSTAAGGEGTGARALLASSGRSGSDSVTGAEGSGRLEAGSRGVGGWVHQLRTEEQ